MKEIRHIFFDLDRTLWDFEENSKQTLLEAIDEFQLIEKGISSPDKFIEQYKVINEKMWKKYRMGNLAKENLRVNRFVHSLKLFGIEDTDLATKLADFYLSESPKKTKLHDNARETLEYLSPKYRLHIITNGFEEVQLLKLNSAKIYQIGRAHV